jgi:hypothetical protein
VRTGKGKPSGLLFCFLSGRSVDWNVGHPRRCCALALRSGFWRSLQKTTSA